MKKGRETIMEAVLYVCHGSRVPKAKEQAVAFIEKCMDKNPAEIQEYCFLELAAPTMEEGFARCVEKGAKKIAVVPVLLLTAAHAKEDIPNEIKNIAANYSNIEVRYGRPIGVHDAMVQILVDKLGRTGKEITEHSMVILVGRGSSDPDVKRDLSTISKMLKKQSGLKRVDICFLTAADPGLDEALMEASASTADRVFVIPYLLFTGILMKTIEKAIVSLDDNQRFILCDELGYHHIIEGILHDRAREALNGTRL
ncbi:sirohydrochlorin chelatase [Mesobacillus foraminis]|uniref:Sirohydrochlorin ferrochelatase n=1 Tax=Mesobacillus foraminis TaxID=279826 RepID=A0A4R2B078_9BACI|nr:sirohydrochlorin chelatase [Mesobacillus foraminis]TCN19355.1 sirohydrochlorin ferrochelatase [Mesobacillus foraminis]